MGGDGTDELMRDVMGAHDSVELFVAQKWVFGWTRGVKDLLLLD